MNNENTTKKPVITEKGMKFLMEMSARKIYDLSEDNTNSTKDDVEYLIATIEQMFDNEDSYKYIRDVYNRLKTNRS